MRRHTDDLLGVCPAPTRWGWAWLIPAGLLAAGLRAGSDPAVGFAIGLAAALSLSGSV